jgi:hypothetical protein
LTQTVHKSTPKAISIEKEKFEALSEQQQKLYNMLMKNNEGSKDSIK